MNDDTKSLFIRISAVVPLLGALGWLVILLHYSHALQHPKKYMVSVSKWH